MTHRNLIPLAALAVAPLLLAEPPKVTPEQLADFERLVAPRIIPYIDGEAIFAAGEARNEQLSARLASYLESIGKTTLISQSNQSPAPEATEPEATEPEETDPLAGLFEPGPEAIVISCSKGLYLDGENREIVYLGDIKIEGRGLTMTCHRDLKAIFNPPPAEPDAKGDEDGTQEEDEEENTLTKFGGFGDLKQFTATGTVRLSGFNEKGQKFYLGGDRALYEMNKDGNQTDSTVTMRGDKLAFLLESPKDPGDPGNKKTIAAVKSTSSDAWVVATLKDKHIKVKFSENGWETVLREDQ